MLAQNFKSAAELGLSEKQFDALVKTLKLMETDQLRHVEVSFGRGCSVGHVVGLDGVHYGSSGDRGTKFSGLFNMTIWNEAADCGTVACIGGTACLIAGEDVFFASPDTSELSILFYPPNDLNYNDISTEEAARALRSYLTTGEARWEEIIS
jgi:hypothetical protein